MWERNIHVAFSYAPQPGTKPATQACALTRDWTGDLSLCGTMPSPLSHTAQGSVLLICLSLCWYHPPWITSVFWLSFEIGKHESSNFVFYFKIISAILGPLQFHMNLRIILSINRFTINTNQDRTVNSRCHWHFSLEWIRKKTERRYVMVTAFGHQRFYYNSIHEMGNNLLCPNN